MEEIAFVAGESGDICAWNIRTGVVLGSYKQNSSGIHSMSYLENSNCLVVAQYNKPSIHTFSLSKVCALPSLPLFFQSLSFCLC